MKKSQGGIGQMYLFELAAENRRKPEDPFLYLDTGIIKDSGENYYKKEKVRQGRTAVNH